MNGGYDPLPAVREAEAMGATAELFDDIRRTLGVPYVNLVWRHLATIPGGLEWTWGVVRPLYRGARLIRQSSELHERVVAGTPAGLPSLAFDAIGVTAGDRERIGRLIASYDHANGLALVALMATRAMLAGKTAAGKTAAGETPGDGSRLATKERPAVPQGPGRHDDWGDLPPLPGLDELPRPVEALVRELDRFGRVGSTPIVASLYRHLAHWPGFLALALAALRTAQDEGRLAAAVRDTVEAGRRAGSDLAGDLDPPIHLEEETRKVVEGGLEEFTERAIGRMVVMGKCMGMLLPEGRPKAACHLDWNPEQ